VTWWLIGVILMAGFGAGLLLARIERVRIRQDGPDSADRDAPTHQGSAQGTPRQRTEGG
jgi:hypothetical protein